MAAGFGGSFSGGMIRPPQERWHSRHLARHPSHRTAGAQRQRPL